MLFILFRRTRNNWTSRGTIFVMQFTRVCCVFRERERDELFVVSCTLHPWTLTPRCPVQPAGPSVSDTVIHNVCRPGMTLLNVLLDGKISFSACSSSSSSPSSVFLIFLFFFRALPLYFFFSFRSNDHYRVFLSSFDSQNPRSTFPFRVSRKRLSKREGGRNRIKGRYRLPPIAIFKHLERSRK